LVCGVSGVYSRDGKRAPLMRIPGKALYDLLNVKCAWDYYLRKYSVGRFVGIAALQGNL